jgi:predicted acyltransferase
MVLVNNPGSWSHIYSPLEHAAWHGWTPTDLIFPFFLFIVGTAMAFSLSRRREEGSLAAVHLKILQRGAILFALGLFLQGFPEYHLADLRIPGVLQRIALAYVLASLLVLHLGVRWQAAAAAAVLLGDWGLLALVPAPGRETASLAMGEDWGSWLDRAVFGSRHLYKKEAGFDPEGLLSTLPAVVTVLGGYWTGLALRRWPRDLVVTAAIAGAGVAAVALGLLWHEAFPINKQLWTSSYVALSAGWAMLALAAVHAATELTPSKLPARLLRPLEAVGRNAILVFVASGLLARVLMRLPAPSGDGNLRAWLAASLAQPFASPQFGSLVYAVLNVALWLGVALLLDRKKWYVKI